MAIKDSLVNNILKSESNQFSSKQLYKRLRQPIDDVDGFKPDTNRTQTRHKLDTNRTQTRHKLDTNWTQNKPEQNTQPDTQPDTNRTQTEHKPDTKYFFSSLVGLQRELLIFLYQDCKAARSRITQEVSLSHISDSLKVPLGSIKTTLMRLVNKKFIALVEFKNGRGGWRKYEIPDEIYRELLHIEHNLKPNTNRTQTEHKPNTQPNTQPNTSPPSSSTFNNKITTTEVSSEWEEIDIEPLAAAGFKKAHLQQLASIGKVKAQDVQVSIFAFAFDLQHNKKQAKLKTDPLNYFMGILRSGVPYAPPANYESAEDKAFREYVERKKELEGKREALKKEAFTLAFNEWRMASSEDEISQFIPDGLKNFKSEDIRTGFLQQYFSENVWVNIEKEIKKGKIEEKTVS